MTVRIIHGDARDMFALADNSIHCAATSPPYWGLRSYLAKDDPRKQLEIGSERTPERYIDALVSVFREVRRVLRDDGSVWVNLGDCYARDGAAPPRRDHSGGVGGGTYGQQGYSASSACDTDRQMEMRSKNLLLMPYRVALAMQADGWILRAACPWIKKSCMPESVTDRPTTAHETIFLFAKSARYFADPDAVRVTMVAGANGSTFTKGKTALDGDRKNIGRGPRSDNIAGRNLRTSDIFDAGLDAYQRALADHAAHVAHIRANGGMLLAENGDPLAFMVNTVPSTYKHFAMWPPDLVKPMLMFSTPEVGVCAACGAPRQRITEKGEALSQRGKVKRLAASEAAQGSHGTGAHSLGCQPREVATLGWEPTCSCTAPSVPATVLDPFGGTGTTARVAEDLGRDSVIVELDAKSIAIAEERTAQAGLFATAGRS